MKEACPVKVAVYAKARNLSHLPAFSWWVPYLLQKADYIILKVKARVRIRKAKYKFGIEVPTSLEHARELNRKNGNTKWYEAWKKEMENVSIAFEFKHHGYKPSSDWIETSGHLIWDVKMDFTRKARWVKDGHKTADIVSSSFAGVVSRESV